MDGYGAMMARISGYLARFPQGTKQLRAEVAELYSTSVRPTDGDAARSDLKDQVMALANMLDENKLRGWLGVGRHIARRDFRL